MKPTTRELVLKVPLFEKFSADSLSRILEHSAVREFEAGEVITRYGKPGQHLGAVLSGQVEVRLPPEAGGPRQLAILKEGSYFGEMSLLTGEPATADVVAADRCSILLIPHETLSLELARNPEAIQELARTLSARLRSREEHDEELEAVEGARRQVRKTRSFRPTSTVAPHKVLVLNLGSSSVKYDYFDSLQPDLVFRGIVERIGQEVAIHKAERQDGTRSQQVPAADHEQALQLVMGELTGPDGPLDSLDELSGIGHRVVHGGEAYSAPVLVDDRVLEAIREYESLAPLHNPINRLGIEVCRKLAPGVPQVAVFDTAFHQTMPRHAYLYALPYELYEKHGLRRYGFHGTSHRYVSLKAASHLGRSSRSLKMITCHLGNGASVTAVDHGRVVDTSMGLTPLEGLVMGTRSGDLDPGLVLHLAKSMDMTPDQVDDLLNRHSGLKGLSGISNDMREIVQAAEEGNPRAILAVQVFCYRLRKYIGAYMAVLGGLDALVFTGGIGEHSAYIRSRVCRGLAHLGILLDEETNQTAHPGKGEAADVAAPDSPVRVLVVPTDEEGMIAADTVASLEAAKLLKAVHPEQVPIPIGVSAHHVHLQQEHVEALFGRGHELTYDKPLYQPGQFACKERVNLVGPKGRVDRVRILGPVRKQTQVEIARTEEFKLGIDAPIRASGDLAGTPGIVLEGPKGRVELREGVICALRHIHMSPADALRLAVRDGDFVRVRVEGERSLIFGDVLVRVKPTYKLEMHVDTDEANAAELPQRAVGYIESIQQRRP